MISTHHIAIVSKEALFSPLFDPDEAVAEYFFHCPPGFTTGPFTAAWVRTHDGEFCVFHFDLWEKPDKFS